MRKQAFSFILIGLAVFLTLAGCRSTATPSPPTVNSFKITGFQFNVQYVGLNGAVVGTYANGTQADVTAAGTVDWGDGQNQNVAGVKIAKNSSSSWSLSVIHGYSAIGIYTVTVNMTAPFSGGSISSSFTQDVVIHD